MRLGKRYQGSATIYLLGGSALCLLGSPRVTADVDYMQTTTPEQEAPLRTAITEVANEMQLDVEDVPLAELIPLPTEAYERRLLIGRFGGVEVYLFDPYSIALSKIARGFEADLEDVLFLLHEGLIEFGDLERFFEDVLPYAPQADIIPEEFQAYFAEVRRRVERLRTDSRR